MPYTTNVAGTTITAAWGNANVRDQVVTPFASTSARDSAITAPVEGMLCYVTATDRFYVYDGSSWVVHSAGAGAGRVGCTLQRAAAQSISNATLTAISWDQEDVDTDAFITVPSGTITIPSGLGGIYSISAQAFSATAWGGNANDELLIVAGGINFYFSTWSGSNGSKTATLIVPLAATNTVSFWVEQNTGGAINFTGRIYVYRLSA